MLSFRKKKTDRGLGMGLLPSPKNILNACSKRGGDAARRAESEGGGKKDNKEEAA